MPVGHRPPRSRPEVPRDAEAPRAVGRGIGRGSQPPEGQSGSGPPIPGAATTTSSIRWKPGPGSKKRTDGRRRAFARRPVWQSYGESSTSEGSDRDPPCRHPSRAARRPAACWPFPASRPSSSAHHPPTPQASTPPVERRPLSGRHFLWCGVGKRNRVEVGHLLNLFPGLDQRGSDVIRTRGLHEMVHCITRRLPAPPADKDL
jgi:hypothetical protein